MDENTTKHTKTHRSTAVLTCPARAVTRARYARPLRNLDRGRKEIDPERLGARSRARELGHGAIGRGGAPKELDRN